MPILNIYSSPTTPGGAGWSEDMSGAIRLGSITGLAGEARLGAAGIGNIVYDDPTSSIGHAGDGIVGLKQESFNELSCPIGNQRLWTGYVGDRTYRRGTDDSLRTGSARKIDVTLIDLNSFLGFRVFAPTADDPTSDFVREAETDLERVQGLLTDVDFISTTLFDVGYIPSTGGVDMDENDYTGMRPIDVLNDCAQASGRNFWVKYHEATNQYVLWYDDWTTDGTDTLVYDSALRLTNVLSEVNGTTTFAGIDAEETVNPDRVISAIRGTGTGVTGYATAPTTAYTYAWRDAAPLTAFVKTQAALDALLARNLADNATEDPTIRVSVQLPNQYVTGIHEGMRLEVHFTHLPSVASEFTWTRVLSRNIRVDVETQQYYWLDLELSPIPVIEEVDVFAILYYDHSHDTAGTVDVDLGWISTGDAPSGGFPAAPSFGPITMDVGPGSDNVNWLGATITGTGTVSFDLLATIAGVPLIGDVATVSIKINGVVVASEAIGPCVSNFTWPVTNAFHIVATDLPITGTSVITTHVKTAPRSGFFCPAGTGSLDQNFTITGTVEA